MVVLLAHQQLHRLAGGFDRGGKFAVLALELRGLAGAVGDDQRRVQSIEMPYRAQRRDRCVVKRDVGIARRQPYWCQIVHAADAHYFTDATLASALVARWCAGSKVETTGGLFQVREDDPAPRVGVGLHRTP